MRVRPNVNDFIIGAMFVLSVPLLAYSVLVSLLEAFLANTYAVVVVLMGVAHAYVNMNAVAKKLDL